MAAPRNRRHLLAPAPPQTEAYTPHPRKVEPVGFTRPGNRQEHAARLQRALSAATEESRTSREAQGITVRGAKPGLYIQFESLPGVPLKLESLEDKREGIELVAVRTVVLDHEQRTIQRATTFVPDGKLKHFFTRFQDYAEKQTKTGEPRNKEMVDRIAEIYRATLHALWTDAEEAFPSEEERIWWEIWLRRSDGRELERLHEFSGAVGFALGPRRLAFDERIVVLANATRGQLSGSLDVLNDIAELRRAKESAARFIDAASDEQAGWVNDLKSRTAPPGEDAPAVCVLDTGVNRGHPLLEILIAESDATAVDPAWGSQDDGGGPTQMGHGTEMCGLAGYGDLVSVLQSDVPIQFRHCLESVKILPPTGANAPDLFGALTAQAVSRPEINAPRRTRSFSLAVTAADERDRGEPTSWSSAIDALAAGRIFDSSTQGLVYLDSQSDRRRLFVISAGNVGALEISHLDRSDLEAVHDPAHAWNALTVGAYTDKAVIDDAQWPGWTPVARIGDLSPWSTTSVLFKEPWPIKPDVVFEGGNVAHTRLL
jgi:hypothetical protein